MKVVYHSFAGRFSDNPRALYEGLLASGRPVEHVWLADPAWLHTFPSDVETVPIYTEACTKALETADVVVSNGHIEQEWDKAPGTLYLQTWHGTPLKHIHFDVLWAPDGRLDRLTRDVRRWDVVLSPNAASTGPLRSAFGFEGPVLETGYPRNDLLSAPHRDDVRDRVRRELGIAPDAKVVLYAPTWRDDAYFADPDREVSLELDVAELTRRLPDHVLLLRLHYMVSDRLAPIEHPDVRDVSGLADISELYLAADVMVTDYSSTMFDFAVTGKPMLFFTYDLEHYRDTLRGFYFDFAEDPPGPLLATSAEVVDALADLAAVSERHAEAYGRFRARFCSLEDGRATSRVLDELFPERVA